jgi:DNA-binding MarR family transcriptional regulator
MSSHRRFAARGFGAAFSASASHSCRLTPTELSRSTMLTTGGMTKRLDRLEANGLVRREADPRDRRGKLIALTDEGRELIDRAIKGHLENEERMLSDISRSDREQLANLLRGMLLSLDR